MGFHASQHEWWILESNVATSAPDEAELQPNVRSTPNRHADPGPRFAAITTSPAGAEKTEKVEVALRPMSWERGLRLGEVTPF